ncbi:MAG: hypothetical protein ACXV5H_07665 [Halobacteriota archaeon]
MSGVVDAGFMKEVYQLSPTYCASLPPGYVESKMKSVNALTTFGYIARLVTETEIFYIFCKMCNMHPVPSHYACEPQRTSRINGTETEMNKLHAGEHLHPSG